VRGEQQDVAVGDVAQQLLPRLARGTGVTQKSVLRSGTASCRAWCTMSPAKTARCPSEETSTQTLPGVCPVAGTSRTSSQIPRSGSTTSRTPAARSGSTLSVT
jgi:hypothetical protein